MLDSNRPGPTPLDPDAKEATGRRIRGAGLLAALRVALVCGALATPLPADSEVERVATGLDRPVFLTAPPEDDGRVFVVEQHTGRIRILRRDGWTLDASPFLSISGLSTGNEQGLLGLAFHPDYATNGQLFVYVTDPTSRVLRYTVSSDPDVVAPQSEEQVLSFSQPQANHNGGWIGFGPDGHLYVASGDGGGSNDSGTGHTSGTGNAQDLTANRYGKILRIDVDGDDFPDDASENYAVPPDNPFVGTTGDDEIWAFGLRNPWRPSFDRATGDLWIADVGQSTCEELNVQPGSSAGGENYGWRLREGTVATPTGGVGGAAPMGAIDPVFDYPHDAGACSDPPAGFTGSSVTGGYVYRGADPDLQGRYFFADFGQGRLWSLVWDGSAPSGFDGSNYLDLVDHSGDPDFVPDAGSIDFVTSYGEDAWGSLYVLDLDGEVFRVPEPRLGAGLLAGLPGLLVAGRRRERRRRQASRRSASGA